MKLLAIDTSSDACSVALQLGDVVVEQHIVGEREHTSILVPMIGKLLAEAGVVLPDLDAVVLGNGPGSFIGMRIGASVAQGLCYGAGLKLVPVSSLAAVAAETFDKHRAEKVLVAQDARMHEVYIGYFRRDADGLPKPVGDEEIRGIGALEVLDEKCVAAGGAWEKFPKLLAENRERISEVAGVVLPRARYLLDLGARAFREGGAIWPDALLPSYIRVKVAEKPQSVA
jgi:tRNA threonylcarbamoyladenosine biosynthesis protein TsaB